MYCHLTKKSSSLILRCIYIFLTSSKYVLKLALTDLCNCRHRGVIHPQISQKNCWCNSNTSVSRSAPLATPSNSFSKVLPPLLPPPICVLAVQFSLLMPLGIDSESQNPSPARGVPTMRQGEPTASGGTHEGDGIETRVSTGKIISSVLLSSLASHCNWSLGGGFGGMLPSGNTHFCHTA